MMRRVQSATEPVPVPDRQLEIGPPTPADGVAVHDLIAACPPLDTNSEYANLLQCSHFSTTCAAARRNGQLVGWVSGYILPEDPASYFLWQVAVDDAARGEGLPKRLILDILARDACRNVRFLKTTITEDNEASWGLFGSFARHLGAEMSREAFFDQEKHFQGRHSTEHLVTIGPFDAQ